MNDLELELKSIHLRKKTLEAISTKGGNLAITAWARPEILLSPERPINGTTATCPEPAQINNSKHAFFMN
jgi:hypothetical protein